MTSWSVAGDVVKGELLRDMRLFEAGEAGFGVCLG